MKKKLNRKYENEANFWQDLDNSTCDYIDERDYNDEYNKVTVELMNGSYDYILVSK